MLDTILTSPFFGLTLSAAAWCAGVWLQKKTGWVLCNPLVIAGVLIIALLAVLDIPLDHYNQGASMIQMILGPVTAVLALTPVTGRTHQLRVHCAYMGFPIVGDPQYGSPESQAFSREMGAATQLLCAKILRFSHPITKTPMEITSTYTIP